MLGPVTFWAICTADSFGGVRLFNAWQFSLAEQLLDDFLCRFPPELVHRRFADLRGLYLLGKAYHAGG